MLRSCIAGSGSLQKDPPKGLKGRNGSSPVHREEKQPRRRLADVVDVEVLWRRQRHNKLKKRGNTSAIMKKPVAPEHQRCWVLVGLKSSATLNGI